MSTMVSGGEAAAVDNGEGGRGLQRRRRATGGDGNGGSGGSNGPIQQRLGEANSDCQGFDPVTMPRPPRDAAGGGGQW